jgi:hypothetical protein
MEEHLYVKIAAMQRSVMQSYVKYWLFMSCCIERLQGGYMHLEAEECQPANIHCSGCFMSIYTDMSVVIIKWCIDKDRHYTLMELAKHTGIFVSTML